MWEAGFWLRVTGWWSSGAFVVWAKQAWLRLDHRSWTDHDGSQSTLCLRCQKRASTRTLRDSARSSTVSSLYLKSVAGGGAGAALQRENARAALKPANSAGVLLLLPEP